jgi:hypothetical protein
MSKKKYLIMGITSSNHEITSGLVDFAVISDFLRSFALVSLGDAIIANTYLTEDPNKEIIESIDFNADHHEINFYSCYGKDINGLPYEFDDIDIQISKERYFITKNWPRVDEMIKENIPIEIKPVEVEGVRLTVHKDGSFNWSANMRKTAEPVTLETIPMEYEDLLNLLKEEENENHPA